VRIPRPGGIPRGLTCLHAAADGIRLCEHDLPCESARRFHPATDAKVFGDASWFGPFRVRAEAEQALRRAQDLDAGQIFGAGR
jgi:hypothetical protein